MPKLLPAVLAALSFAIANEDAFELHQPANATTILVGCLRQGRADATTANSGGIIYTLEATAQKLPTSPAPEGSGPVKVDRRYALSFEKSVDLSKHVDHKVEVRGHRLRRPDAEPRSGAAKATENPTAKPLPGAAEQMFHVTEIRMVAASCK